MSQQKNACKKTYIGGQAVMEGVMMRGKRGYACAVRDDEGTIQVESRYFPAPDKKTAFLRLPFVRGVVSLVDSMVFGTKIMMRSAQVYAGVDDEEQPSKFEQWLSKRFNGDISAVIATVSVVLGLVLSIGLFVFLPYLFSKLISNVTGLNEKGIAFNFIEGGFRILIFIAYLWLTSLMKDVKRTYMYHGAEHKTITCFEKGLPLTVENVRTCKRVHDRCGTTFLFLVMVLAILVFSVANSFIPFTIENPVLNFLVRLLIKLLLLPVVAGLSYELLRLLAKTDSPLVYPLKAPGLALQHLTTSEPTDDMIECAITAFDKVLKMDGDKEKTVGESAFAIAGKLSSVREDVEKLFTRANIEGDDAKWIFSLTLDIPMSVLDGEGERMLTVAETRKIYKIANERLSGKPLWYVIGNTSFCGFTIKVNENVLIPRPETETLFEQALQMAKSGDRVLDLCTGSGALAVALKKTNPSLAVTASDVSQEALGVAEENAKNNAAEINFVLSDLFEKIEGKFNVIVTNPPYIPTQEISSLQREVREFEPHLALDGGEDGLKFYRRIAKDCAEHLTEGGCLLTEVGAGQAQEVASLFVAQGFTCQIVKDLCGVDRIVKAVKNN